MGSVAGEPPTCQAVSAMVNRIVIELDRTKAEWGSPGHSCYPGTFSGTFNVESYIETVRLMAFDAHTAWQALEAAEMDMNPILNAAASLLRIELHVHSQGDLIMRWFTMNEGGGPVKRVFQRSSVHFLGTRACAGADQPSTMANHEKAVELLQRARQQRDAEPSPAPAPPPPPPPPLAAASPPSPVPAPSPALAPAASRPGRRNITRVDYRAMSRGSAGESPCWLLSMPKCAWVSVQLSLWRFKPHWCFFNFETKLTRLSKPIHAACQGASLERVLRYELSGLMSNEGETAAGFMKAINLHLKARKRRPWAFPRCRLCRSYSFMWKCNRLACGDCVSLAKSRGEWHDHSEADYDSDADYGSRFVHF